MIHLKDLAKELMCLLVLQKNKLGITLNKALLENRLNYQILKRFRLKKFKISLITFRTLMSLFKKEKKAITYNKQNKQT